jgi:DNA-binding MarR family transcriptional regulator
MRKAAPWELWTLTLRLQMSVLAEVEPRLQALRITVKELLLLGELDAHPHPAELARALMLPKPSVTFMVKRVEAEGYVRREVQPGDLRRFRLTLTAAGRRALEEGRAILDEAFGRRVERLTQAQVAELRRSLERMS